MSLKQLISPRKSKKRPYRRRVRNKTHTSINCNDIGIEAASQPTHHKQKSLLSLNTNIITNKSPNGPPPVPPRNVITHSRTLSYISSKKATIQTPKKVTHSRLNTALTPITIETTFTSPVSPYNSNVSPTLSPITQPPRTQDASQNTNYLTFTEATQNFSVSLPSSPVEPLSSAKNMRFNHVTMNKMQRFSSASHIHQKTPKMKPYDGENVRVMVRFRPINKSEKKYTERYLESPFKSPTANALCSFPHNITITNKHKKIKMHYFSCSKKAKEADHRSYAFRFNQVFDVKSGQKDTFDAVAKPICDDILQFKSNHGTIFCYGQSGSGKTYTMFGAGQNANKKNNNKRGGGAHRRCTSARIAAGGANKEKENDIESMGIIGRSCCYMFDELKDIKESLYNVYTDFTYNVYLECIEIYNEKLKDLLNSKQTPVIREIETKRHSKVVRNGVVKKGPKIFTTEIQNVTRKHVKSIKEMVNILQISSLNRNVSKTSLNESSSRSHMIIRLIVKTVNSDNNKRTESIINFVDLAGSENIKKSSSKKYSFKSQKTRKKQVKEAGNILKSLTALSQVIDALIKNKKHIPYKDSKLTRMLQNSLGGNCKTALLICASPHIYNRYETIRSLKFGLRCQQIRNFIKCEYDEVASTPMRHSKPKRHKKPLQPPRTQERERDQCHRLSIKQTKPQLKLNDSKSLTLTLNEKDTMDSGDSDAVTMPVLPLKHNNKSLEMMKNEASSLTMNTSLELDEMELHQLELKDNKSVVFKDDKYERLMKQIEELNVENDLLRTKDNLSQNVTTLNESISRIVLQNAFRMNKNKRKKKKMKAANNQANMMANIATELNVFDSELMQITIALNAKIAKIQDLVHEGLLFCDREDDDEDEEDSDDTEEEEEDAEIVVFNDHDSATTVEKRDSEDSSVSTQCNQKIYSETIVQQLKQQNETLQDEIKRLKLEREQSKKKASVEAEYNKACVMKPTPLQRGNQDGGYSDYDEENDTYYICDDDEVYCNIYDTESDDRATNHTTPSQNHMNDRKKLRVNCNVEEISASTANLPSDEDDINNNSSDSGLMSIEDEKAKDNLSIQSINALKEKTTLSEQLNIMEKLRTMDKDNLEYLQMPNSLQKYKRWAVSPRDSITLLNTHATNQSNRSSNSSFCSAFGQRQKTAQSITSNSTFYDSQSPTSARSSLNSHTSAVSTTIDSIDEHLEKWNGVSSKPRRSTIGYNGNRRRSSTNTAISISLSSTTLKDMASPDMITPKTGVVTPEIETSVSHTLSYADIDFADDEDDKQCIMDLQSDPILKEENEEENEEGEQEEEEEEDEEEEVSDDDQYDYSTDDDTYYSNNYGGNEVLGDGPEMNKMSRTRTDSQIFRSEGMELTKKFRAKSVESPCINNQRLSNSFAMHWINLKKKK